MCLVTCAYARWPFLSAVVGPYHMQQATVTSGIAIKYCNNNNSNENWSGRILSKSSHAVIRIWVYLYIIIVCHCVYLSVCPYASHLNNVFLPFFVVIIFCNCCCCSPLISSTNGRHQRWRCLEYLIVFELELLKIDCHKFFFWTHSTHIVNKIINNERYSMNFIYGSLLYWVLPSHKYHVIHF